MKILAITQARVGSSRLPGKVLKIIEGNSLLSLHLKRIKKSKLITDLLVATTKKAEDDLIAIEAESLEVSVFRGSENDVLDRFYQAAQIYSPDIIVRLTSDCPLIDSRIIDDVIKIFIDSQLDYCSNTLVETFPDGQDVEVFTFNALKTAWEEAKLTSEREHVTPFIKKNSTHYKKEKFNSLNFPSKFNEYKNVRMTVDEMVDFNLIMHLVKTLGTNLNWEDYASYCINNIDILNVNQKIVRNEGYIKSLNNDKMMGSGQNLYKKAKKLIPGGTMLLSKRPEMFLPDLWPSYFSRAKGCEVWDLDGNKYIDMSIMGIGTNTLGYGNEEVDRAVIETIIKGNMSTLNCPEEVLLAEKLIDINPWADMVRFARSGGEANSIAIRIGRAASGKDKVAICGYHGWHDWYLSANHNEGDGLSGHLIPGLSPNGVPKNLKNTVFPFNYNNYEELLSIVNNNEIGVIKMEVIRNFEPQNDFLQKVRSLATKRKIVLIFDECTSGFRETFGGIYQKYKVEPDLAMYGKTIGNGYALTAVVGKKSVMEVAQTTFISSTFWTERIGPTAALATLSEMEKIKSWEIITKKGNKMREGWNKLAKENNLSISISGIPALSAYGFNSDKSLFYKTYVTQEMMKSGFLASNSFYACTEHKDEYFESYLDALNNVFHTISKCENDELRIEDLLLGPVCHSGFNRLN